MEKYSIALLLVFTTILPVFSNAYATTISVEFDKEEYAFGDSLSVSGQISDFSMPVIAFSIFDPDGKILSANNLELDSEGNFSKIFSLDSPFYEKTGEYKIKLDYGQISQNEFFTITGDVFESVTSIESIPEIISLTTDKSIYTDQDIVVISGTVSSQISPTVLIGVYDTFGTPAGFYFGQINSDLEFSSSFLIKAGVNFKIDGTYSIKAHYAEKEKITIFDFFKIIPEIQPETVEQETVEQETVEQETVEQETVEQETVEQETVEQETVEQETVEQETVEQETVEQETPSEIVELSPIPKIIEPKLIDQPVEPKIIELEIDNTIFTNLSVEDIELGKILNQINLDCDSSVFVDMISYYDGMGPALYRLCNFDSSLNFFTNSLNQDPNDVKILVNTGSAIGKLGDFSKAIFYYDLALDVDSTFLPAKNNKANALANLGNLDDAILLYRQILDENPNSVTTQKNLAIAYSLVEKSQNKINTSVVTPIENIDFQEPILVEKTSLINNEKQKPMNFFEQINSVFSSFGNFFNFLN